MKWLLPDDLSDIGEYEVEAYGLDKDRSSKFIVSPGRFRALSSNNINRLGSRIKFRVRAYSTDVNASNDSQWSEYSEVLTINGSIKLNEPTGVSYSPETGALTWNSVGGAEYYRIEVYYAETENGERRLVDETETEWNKYFLQETVGLGWYFVNVCAAGDDQFFTDSGWSSCTVRFSSKIPLGTPTELSWGRECRRDGAGGLIWRDIPGTVSWKRGLDQARYNVHLYRVTEGPGEDEEVACWTDWHSATNADAYLSSPAFLNGDAEHIDFESGTYYFTVQALGDGINYDDGAVATSETWTYTKPETKLPVLTGTAWKNGDMVWAAPADLAGYYGYETNVYFAAADEDTPELIGGTTALDFDTVDYLDDYLIESYGEGCYWFRVRAISFDITKQCNSDWSELCGPYRLGDVSEEVKSNLNGVLEELGDEPTTAADVAQAIKAQLADSNMSVQDLANAMSADDGAEGGTLELIAELEKKVGVTTEIAVAEDMKDTFSLGDVSVVGAGLNAGAGTEVTLNIGEPTPGKVIPALYSSTVQFSMHLDGGVDEDGAETGNQKLAMPVSITLPVPAGINPAFLVVLHYIESEDRYEEVWPYVYEDNGKWYASFTVTSFSDFALATINITGEAVEGGVSVVVNFAVDLPGLGICAVYGDGQQLSIAVLTDAQAKAGVGEIFVPCDAGKADEIKFFILDDDKAPMFVAAECDFGA